MYPASDKMNQVVFVFTTVGKLLIKEDKIKKMDFHTKFAQGKKF